jgi:hypothetical protein
MKSIVRSSPGSLRPSQEQRARRGAWKSLSPFIKIAQSEPRNHRQVRLHRRMHGTMTPRSSYSPWRSGCLQAEPLRQQPPDINVGLPYWRRPLLGDPAAHGSCCRCVLRRRQSSATKARPFPASNKGSSHPDQLQDHPELELVLLLPLSHATDVRPTCYRAPPLPRRQDLPPTPSPGSTSTSPAASSSPC